MACFFFTCCCWAPQEPVRTPSWPRSGRYGISVLAHDQQVEARRGLAVRKHGCGHGGERSDKQKCNCECPCAGNPFVIATGAKTETVTDYETSGFNKLSMVRYYNMYPGAWWIGQDSGTPAAVPTALERSWRSNFDRYLNVVSSDALVAERQGGEFLSFAWNGSGWAPDSDVDVQLVQAGSTFTLTDTDDTVETYTVDGSGKGRLTRKTEATR